MNPVPIPPPNASLRPLAIAGILAAFGLASILAGCGEDSPAPSAPAPAPAPAPPPPDRARLSCAPFYRYVIGVGFGFLASVSDTAGTGGAPRRHCE